MNRRQLLAAALGVPFVRPVAKDRPNWVGPQHQNDLEVGNPNAEPGWLATHPVTGYHEPVERDTDGRWYFIEAPK